MSNPTFYARIQNKYDTKANLDKSTFIPKSGELIGASGAGTDSKYKKLKIGDGTNKYSALQFVDQEAIDLANAAQDTADEALEEAQAAAGAAQAAQNATDSLKYAASASIGGPANYALKMQTYKQGSTTETYGNNYPVYAQWISNSRLKFISDGYTTETDMAEKLTSSAGSATQPVYFTDGKPVACTYTLGKSVPSDAKFTDTVYTLPAATSSTLGGVKVGSNITNSSGTISLTKANVTAALGYTPPTTDTNTHYTTGITAGASGTTTNAETSNPYIKIKDDSTHRSQIQIKGSGATTVSSDANGVITISSTDNNTTYSAGTGISLSDTTFSNSGVRSIVSGSTNGTISVNTNGTSAEVLVAGLGTAAFSSSANFATAAQGTLASNAMPKSGGTFTGDAVAYSTNRTTSGLRNTEVRITSATGTLQSTNKIIMVRK